MNPTLALATQGLVDPGGLAETLPPALIAATNLQLDAAARRVGDG